MWYREGTVTFTKSSNIITGVGTAWNVTANGVLPGMIVVAPDGKLYEIKRVNTDTSIELVDAWSGETQSDVPCCIITTYEGDLTQFSARFTALMSRMSNDSKAMRSWLTSDSEVTIEQEDGSEVTIKPLSEIIKEHKENIEWYKNNTETIDGIGETARIVSEGAEKAAQSVAEAQQHAEAAKQSATSVEEFKNAAESSANAAKESETSALESKNAAASYVTTVSEKATEAEASANSASESKEAAKLSEMNASSSSSSVSAAAAQAQEAAKAAQDSSKQASDFAEAAKSAKEEVTIKSEEVSTAANEASSKISELTARAEEVKQSQEAALASAERAEVAAERAEDAMAAVNLQDATTSVKGVVKLSSDVASTSEEFAATPKAVKTAYDLANSKYTAQNATTSQKGLVQLNSETDNESETLAATPKAVKDVKDLVDQKAALDSPAFTGAPTAPTAAQGTNNTQIATTAYVREAISNLVNSAPGTLDTLNELANALGNDPDFATTITGEISKKQPLDATLTSLANLSTAANKFPYFTGNDTAELTDITEFGREALKKASATTFLEHLGLKENGTSGNRIPLLSTANTWSAKQAFEAGLSGALTGNADTATKLASSRKIGGVPFDGSSDISLPGVNAAGNQSTSGNAATATKLATPRSIGGVLFDGSANIDLPGVNKAGNQNTTGNAASATKLQTARNIGGVSFNGTANIDLPGVNKQGNQNTTGNAATATKLATARTINGVAFDGTQNIEITVGQLGATKYSPNLSSGATQKWTTAQFISWLNTQGAFDSIQWSTKCSWNYNTNCYIGNESTGCGNIPLAGAVIEVFSTGPSNYTIRVTTASTSNVPDAYVNSEFVHIHNGASYSPTWYRNFNSKRSITASDVGALAANGNAVSASKLATARTIGGVSFNGTSNINLPGVNMQGNQNTTGNAATATRLATARTINGVAFDGTKNISLTPNNIGALSTSGGTINGALTVTGLLRGNGNASFNDVEIRSDKRSKRNYQRIHSALDKIENLTGYLFEIQNGDGWKQSAGLFAQDVLKIQPELVGRDIDALSGEERLLLNYNGVIGLIVEGIKELRNEIRELKETVNG
ncbi:tail fiber protein [Escherichia coli]|nr:tail fiber protein [Escherichia coli]HBQ4879976.1 tail fiber protein [Escherichia coli]